MAVDRWWGGGAGGIGPGQLPARMPDLLWPWRQQAWLLALPVVELALGLGLLVVLMLSATLRQLSRRQAYAWRPSDSFAPAEQDIAGVVRLLANMPREVVSWQYSGAMATRVTLVAIAGSRVDLRVDVPAERAGVPLATALALEETELRPWLEAADLAEPSGPSRTVPVAEVPEGGTG